MRAVHYLNQFFAGLGGEEAAETPPTRLDGAVGPGRGLVPELDGVEIVATVASAGFGVDASVLPFLDRWGYHVAGTEDLVRNGTRRVDEAELEPRPGEVP